MTGKRYCRYGFRVIVSPSLMLTIVNGRVATQLEDNDYTDLLTHTPSPSLLSRPYVPLLHILPQSSSRVVSTLTTPTLGYTGEEYRTCPLTPVDDHAIVPHSVVEPIYRRHSLLHPLPHHQDSRSLLPGKYPNDKSSLQTYFRFCPHKVCPVTPMPTLGSSNYSDAYPRSVPLLRCVP